MNKQFLRTILFLLLLTNVSMVGAIGLEANNDKVGIGIAAPTAKLEIVGDGNTNATKALEVFDTGSTNSLFTIQDDGNVGIGTTTPAQQLSLYKYQADNGIRIQGSAALWDIENKYSDSGALSFSEASGEKMRITKSGNLGIGTTSPGATLDIKANSSAQWASPFAVRNNNGDLRMFLEQNLAGATEDYYLMLRDTTNTNKILLNPSGNTYFIGGNVGIGTTSPATNLHIKKQNDSLYDVTGAINFNYLELENLSTILGTGTGLELRAGSGVSRIATVSNATNQSDLLFATRDQSSGVTEKMRITSNGKVGIGTIAPGSKLSVTQDQANMSADVPLVSLSTTGTAADTKGAILHLSSTRGGGTDDTDLFKISDTVGTLFTVRNNGKVGIGTTSPSSLLTIKDSGVAAFAFEDSQISVGFSTISDNISSSSISLRNSTASNYGYSISSNRTTSAQGVFAIRYHNNTSAGVDRFIIDSVGNVGIGTASPAYALDVAGSIGLTTNINQKGTLPQMDINPYQSIRLGRSTNNSSFALQVFKGDNTPTLAHRLSGQSYNQIDRYGNKTMFGSSGVPTEIVDVAGNIKSNASFITDNGTSKIVVSSASAFSGYLQGYDGGTTTARYIRMQPVGGNVKIGSGVPSEKLDVAGNIKANGSLIANDVFLNLRNYKHTGVAGMADFMRFVVLLHEVYDGTLSNERYTDGTLYFDRGNSTASYRKYSVYVNSKTAYSSTYASLESTSSDINQAKLITCTYNGIKYIGVEVNYQAQALPHITFEGQHYSQTLNEPLAVAYYNEATSTVLNAEINNSISDFVVNNRKLFDYDQVNFKGNVGIGTTTPSEKLDVAGNIKADELKIGGGRIYWDATAGEMVIQVN